MLPGRVVKVNEYPATQYYYQANLKEYETVVKILDSPKGLRDRALLVVGSVVFLIPAIHCWIMGRMALLKPTMQMAAKGMGAWIQVNAWP